MYAVLERLLLNVFHMEVESFDAECSLVAGCFALNGQILPVSFFFKFEVVSEFPSKKCNPACALLALVVQAPLQKFRYTYVCYIHFNT